MPGLSLSFHICKTEVVSPTLPASKSNREALKGRGSASPSVRSGPSVELMVLSQIPLGKGLLLVPVLEYTTPTPREATPDLPFPSA